MANLLHELSNQIKRGLKPQNTIPVASLFKYYHSWQGMLEKLEYNTPLGFWGDQITNDISQDLQLGNSGKNFYVDWGNITSPLPEFLLNNSTYPIGNASITDELVFAEADKGETVNTLITDDEMNGLPYDKPGSGANQHRKSMNQGVAKRGLWRIAAPNDTSNQCFVYTTTGPVIDASGTRKSLSSVDLLQIKNEAKKRGFDSNLVIVLTLQHIMDLVLTDTLFKDMYVKNNGSGKPINYLGIDIVEAMDNPYYNLSTKEKLAYGSTPVSGTHEEASIGFKSDRIVKAFSEVYFYNASAANNPQMRQTEFGTRRYFLYCPLGEQNNCQVSVLNGY
jgi:hypothetical protein